MDEKTALSNIFKNIDEARRLSDTSNSIKYAGVVSGSAVDQENWQSRFEKTRNFLFNSNGTTRFFSLQEIIGNKQREGNFLGTLLAYKKIRELSQTGEYKKNVILLGMIFGRGERMSPFTQIEGNRKPAIKVNSNGIEELNMSLMAIEEAILYFTPVAKFLENRGFTGILDKWGDETEIPSVDLTLPVSDPGQYSQFDVIKFVSTLKITQELAFQKDWVISDQTGNMAAQLSRSSLDKLICELKQLNIKPAEDGNYYGGVSLGPVAVSYPVLDIAEKIFAEEILKEDVWFDFDPYFLMALCMENKPELWQEKVIADKNLEKLTIMIPGFFEKVQRIKIIFEKTYNRKLNIKIFDLGEKVFWADIGQHHAMRQKYMALLEDNFEGRIARCLENIKTDKDSKGNIIVHSQIDENIDVSGSVIINSRLTGSGTIRHCVIKDSTLNNPVMETAFAVLSHRTGNKTELQANSGIYNSVDDSALCLEPGRKSGTLFSAKGKFELEVSEESDLRDKNIYGKPVFNNTVSFAEAYDIIAGTSMQTLEERKREWIESH